MAILMVEKCKVTKPGLVEQVVTKIIWLDIPTVLFLKNKHQQKIDNLASWSQFACPFLGGVSFLTSCPSSSCDVSSGWPPSLPGALCGFLLKVSIGNVQTHPSPCWLPCSSSPTPPWAGLVCLWEFK